jgi:hypothetical protein
MKTDRHTSVLTFDHRGKWLMSAPDDCGRIQDPAPCWTWHSPGAPATPRTDVDPSGRLQMIRLIRFCSG